MMAAEPTETPRGHLPGAARRRAREVALQVLYAIDLATDRPRARALPDASPPGGQAPSPPAEPASVRAPAAGPVFDAVAAHFEMPAAARTLARDLSVAVRARVDEIDALVTAHARNWRLVRMAAVDRNILRLATYELRYTDTPTAVVLNEAIDLARRFGGDTSPAFVNGILDAVAREVREPA
jgi:N utilization substance protein B